MRLRNIPGAKDAILECDWVIDEPEKFKGEWASVFGEKRPLFLEVGMGKGRFLMDMARLHPERNYVGIEMYDSVLLRHFRRGRSLRRPGRSFQIWCSSVWMQGFCRRFLRRMRLTGFI